MLDSLIISFNKILNVNQEDDKNNLNKIIIRSLELNDYYKNYFELLSQLTKAPQPTYEVWQERFYEITKSRSKVFVIEDLDNKKIIGSILCSIEPKFIRNLGLVCHFEDIVIDETYRNKKLGGVLINIGEEFAKIAGCYRIVLTCQDKVIGFYEKMGYYKKSNGMTKYLIDKDT